MPEIGGVAARSSKNALKHGFRSAEAIASQKEANQHFQQVEQILTSRTDTKRYE